MDRVLTLGSHFKPQLGTSLVAGGNSSRSITAEQFIESLDVNVFDRGQPQWFLDDTIHQSKTSLNLVTQIKQIEFLEHVFVKLDALQAEGNDEFSEKSQFVKNGLLNYIRTLDPRHKLNDRIFEKIGVLEIPKEAVLLPPPNLDVKTRNDRIDFYRRSINSTNHNLVPEIKSSATQGFVNLSNTCYANAALKALIIPIGANNLHHHLGNVLVTNTQRVENLTKYLALSENSVNSAEKVRLETLLNTKAMRAEIVGGNQKLGEDARALMQEVRKRYEGEVAVLPTYNQAIRTFLPVITDSGSGNGPLKHQLSSFFDVLQKTDLFNRFKLIGTEQDSHEFISKLGSIFQLDKIKGRQITRVEHFSREDKEGFEKNSVDWKLESNVSHDITLQAMWDDLSKAEKVDYKWDGDRQDTKTAKSTSYALDTSVGNSVYHHINAMRFGDFGASKVELNNLKVNSAVTFRCTDVNDNKRYELTLEARQMMIHSGSANSGHYYMVAKREDGKWDVHNDARVSVENSINSKEQVKFINYVITGRKAIG